MTDKVDRLATGLLEPARVAKVAQYHRALLKAMNGSVDACGEQDALAVLEAISLLLGQIIGGMPPGEQHVPLRYVMLRALRHADSAVADGTAAQFSVEPDDMGQGGHA